MKYLYLIRHAKSSWQDPALPDLERVVTDSGRVVAEQTAQVLAAKKIKPDLMIASHAIRAQETAHIFAKALHYPESKIVKAPEIYECEVGVLLDLVKSTPKAIETLFIVGHNPSLSWLANYLSDQSYINLSTCGVFAIAFDVKSWDQISEVDGKLLYCDDVVKQ